jgi:hypothetical protein
VPGLSISIEEQKMVLLTRMQAQARGDLGVGGGRLTRQCKSDRHVVRLSSTNCRNG